MTPPTPENYFQFEKLLVELALAGVDFAVVGGVAVSLNGFVRATDDVDIIVSDCPENIGRLLEALSRWGEGWAAGGKQTVRNIMDFVLRMKTYEYEMPDELASFKMDGDWVVDPDAQPALKLAALCEIIRSASGPSLAFQEKQLSRDVVIATGEFIQHPTFIAAGEAS